jgi:excinuclease ABC subunit A
MIEEISIIGAREHNLKNISLKIPKNKLIVFTGPSGSGKSTLAFDTIYAEGQRRYIESLSSYARQFLDRIGKPDIDKIEGLTPSIAIDQKTTSKNPRSTVGTITEVYDYLRLLFARIGKQYCYNCSKAISTMSSQDIIKEVLRLPNGSKIILMAPLVKEKKGTFSDLLESARQKGFVRAMIDGVTVRLDEDIELSKTKKHTIKIIVDRLVIKDENRERITDGVEKALKESFGEIEVDIQNSEEMGISTSHIHHSKHLACFDCKISFEPLEPQSFSFNSPSGACNECDGLGLKYTIDNSKIINDEISISSGAIKLLHGFNKSYYSKFLTAFCECLEIDTKKPFGELLDFEKKSVLNGSADDIEFTWKRHKIVRKWPGALKIAYDMLKDDKEFGGYMSEKVCYKCNGNRLNKSSLSVKVAEHTISGLTNMSIEDIYSFFTNNANFSYFTNEQKLISAPILKELSERLFFLFDVGLGYLSLGRDARTISGGEAQRIRVASQIGSGLTGVTYVLDEPSIGLHERDTLKLIRTLKSLQSKGNTVIVVEHDKETIQNADYIIDIGPHAGKAGGNIVFAGDYQKLKNAKTTTADYLFGRKTIDYAKDREKNIFLEIKNVTINNVKNLSCKFPLKNFVSITGVSGSGKSSLILQTLLPFAKEMLNNAKKITKIKGVTINGLEHLDKAIYLDQSPIGRTPRSNPATYTGAMDEIRTLFSKIKLSITRGYKIGRFSFNVKGGRCEKCQGEGEIKIEMHFLPDIMVKCVECGGNRYNKQTLDVLYKGKNIAETLAMSVDEACEFFTKIPKLYAKLKRLQDVGLGYISLGQNAVTLSGGEAQRIKLAKELSKKDTGKTLYVLDEPTTGLHFVDIDKLVSVLHHLVDLGNSVVVIEHNMEVIKNSDYIIDLGPEGGDKGGKIVDIGTPKEIADNYKQSGSHTGEFLAKELK